MRSPTLIRVFVLSAAVAIGVPATAQTPGEFTTNQVVGIVAAELNARGKTLSNATPQDLSAAAYAATRSNPGQAANVVSALSRTLSPAQIQAVAQGVSNAVNDAAGAGQISPGAAATISSSVSTVTSTVTAPGGGGGGGGFSFPSAAPAAQGFSTSGSGGGIGGATTTPVGSGG